MKTAAELLKDNVVIDTHLDLLFDVECKHRAGRKNVIVEDYLDSFRAGGVDVVVSSIFIDAEFLPELGLSKALDQISAFYHEFDSCGGAFVLATCTDDILRARSEGKLAIMLAFEGIEPLCGRIAQLRAFYALGVRIVGLCWSRSNWAADGSRFFDAAYEGYGLTEAGRALVAEARRLGMLIDVSHTNEKTFWDVLRGTPAPVIATHSCARALSDTPRNLSDAQIKAIADCGGVIGVNGASLVAKFSDPKSATIDTLIDHYEYEKKLASPALLGIGFDQCDRIAAQSATMQSDPALSAVFDIVPTHDGLVAFTERLIARGFSEDEISGLLGGNVMRVLRTTIG
ncbi:MAG: membrane dipeptidase [Clostridia bacterium]|nr:membrane dipeptidase [Clostridia bacterium]